MTIKHLVISGGGPYGISFLGILEYLHDQGFWKIEDIESMYATSIGTILSTVICLNYDWETVNKYFIERPWKDIFKDFILYSNIVGIPLLSPFDFLPY